MAHKTVITEAIIKRAASGDLGSIEYQQLGVSFMLSSQADAATMLGILREIRLLEIAKIVMLGVVFIYLLEHI